MKNLAHTFGIALTIVVGMTFVFLLASNEYTLAAEPTLEELKLSVQTELAATLTSKEENDKKIVDLTYDLETTHLLAEEIDAKIKRLRREVRKFDNKMGITPLTLGDSIDSESNEPSN